MATCTRAAFLSSGACWTNQYFSHHDQQAIIVYRLAAWADAAGGSNYLGTLTTTLLTDANDATCGMTNDQMTAALISMLAEAIGSTEALPFTGGVEVLLAANASAAIKCLKNVSNRTLKAMQLYLACYLISRIEA